MLLINRKSEWLEHLLVRSSKRESGHDVFNCPISALIKRANNQSDFTVLIVVVILDAFLSAFTHSAFCTFVETSTLDYLNIPASTSLRVRYSQVSQSLQHERSMICDIQTQGSVMYLVIR